ncbi:MAG TPA: DNA-directed RNA polymerase subunit alpha [Bacteroidota bacterium]|jgi:DNA-directed RNA polymerase subunit alpha|nr:DNA-directed RNA polymerase subunit alpha [Bacteroidota bacterium]
MTTGTIQMPEKIQLDDSTYSNTFGRFIIQPLEKGFGVTIGNAMRRVLLSSLPGYAITALRVDGIQHEFSTIPGVVEDAPDMILNLKQVRMKLVNKKTNRVLLPLRGPMEFTAGEIQKASPDVEILNPSLHIATLNSEANFELDLRINRGVGYVVAEENKSPDHTVGMVVIDSIFSPIKNVRYFIETTRVGQQTDYEKLTLEVETDGSVTPDDALAHAGKILRDHIQLFINFDMEPEAEKEESEQDAEFARIRKVLLTPVDELELSVRSHNCLRAANIKTIADLVRKDESELLKFRNFGRKSLAELAEIVEAEKLTFGMDVGKYIKDGE